MFKLFNISLFFLCFNISAFSQLYSDSLSKVQGKLHIQFVSAIEFGDAAINSIAALNSLIKKENYRNKISSFNNPTSNDMGFNLQLEINSALKPLLDKAKNTNTNKFMDVVGSLVSSQNKTKSLIPVSGIFNVLTSLVGNLTVNEKHISRIDLDNFVINVSKFFSQYEKLNRINQKFDVNIDKVDLRLQELQIDLRNYLFDLVIAYNNTVQRNVLKQKNTEEIFLNYLDKTKIDTTIDSENPNNIKLYFPSDAIKTAKDITSTIQKIFTEYQKIYKSNYDEIKGILQETKSLGKSINIQTVDNSISELQSLYEESKNADILNIRVNTLNERLKSLVLTEKFKR